MRESQRRKQEKTTVDSVERDASNDINASLSKTDSSDTVDANSHKENISNTVNSVMMDSETETVEIAGKKDTVIIKNGRSFKALKAELGGVFSTRSLALTGIFAAMSWVLYMFVKFPIPMIFPSFLDFQISDLPALICGFILGPIQAILVLLIKLALKLPFSTTLGVGELADLIVGLGFLLPPTIIYRFNRNYKSAVIGISVGVICSTAVAVIANYFILIPFFVQVFFKGNWEILLGEVRSIYPAITKETFFKFYLTYAIIPFNLIRGTLSGIITLLVYKRLSKALKGVFMHKKRNNRKD